MIDHTILMEVSVTLDMLFHVMYYARMRSWNLAEQQLAQIESNFHACLSFVAERGVEEFAQLIVFGDCIDLALMVPIRCKDSRLQRIRDRMGCLSSIVRGMWNILPDRQINLLDEDRPQPKVVFRSLARYQPANVITLASSHLMELDVVWGVLLYLRQHTLVTPFIPKHVGDYLLHCSEHPSALQFQLSPSGMSLAKEFRIAKRRRAIIYQIGSHPKYKHRVAS